MEACDSKPLVEAHSLDAQHARQVPGSGASPIPRKGILGTPKQKVTLWAISIWIHRSWVCLTHKSDYYCFPIFQICYFDMREVNIYGFYEFDVFWNFRVWEIAHFLESQILVLSILSAQISQRKTHVPIILDMQKCKNDRKPPKFIENHPKPSEAKPSKTI